MILAATGHRPPKAGLTYDMNSPGDNYVSARFDEVFNLYKPDYIISGLALGVDTLWAISALYRGIKVVAAIPFLGQEGNWPKKSQELYNKILSHKLVRKHYVCEPGYAAWKMQVRNQWMSDHCNILVAYWDGTPGGTANCIEYAEKKGVEILNIHPNSK